MEHRLWYHGTSKENADSILAEGFREGTYFAKGVEDALCMGGPYMFAVRFDNYPASDWQMCLGFPISPDRIHSLRYFEVELLQFNPDESQKLHHAGLIHWHEEEGRRVKICTTCDGHGELGLVRDGRFLLPHGSPGAAKEDDTTVCPDCKGYGIEDRWGDLNN